MTRDEADDEYATIVRALKQLRALAMRHDQTARTFLATVILLD